MSEKSPYFDKRQEFFRSFFTQGLGYQDYVLSGQPHEQQQWNAMEARIQLSVSQIERLKQFKRRMPVLVMAGTWCGDCVRQGAMFRLIERHVGQHAELGEALMTFRYLDNRANPTLQDELRINGAQKVPVVVSLSEDFYEVGRFGDRHLSVYKRKSATELGAACDLGLLAPPEDELKVELDEWISYFERLQLLLRLAPALRKRYSD